MRVHLREATSSDLPTIARIHRSAYSREHFLALLPEEVLVDYYARFLGGGSRIIVACDEEHAASGSRYGELAGFAVYGRHIEARIASFKAERRWAILRTALVNPRASLGKLLKAISRRNSGRPAHVPAPALVLSIAVTKAGKGIGGTLLEEVLTGSFSSGERTVGLYVRHQNVTAINAYLKVGFSIVMSLTDQFYMEATLSGGGGKMEAGVNCARASDTLV